MIDVMLDLETLSTEQDAIVTNIGAVKMDMESLEVQEHGVFSMALNWNDQFKLGRSLHPSTVRFWLSQDREAIDGILKRPIVDNESVLKAFEFFMVGVDGLWGNGADFDCGILHSLFKTYGRKTPWKYKQHRCFRTMKNLNPDVVPEKPTGIHHNALDDAIYQARWLMRILAA